MTAPQPTNQADPRERMDEDSFNRLETQDVSQEDRNEEGMELEDEDLADDDLPNDDDND